MIYPLHTLPTTSHLRGLTGTVFGLNLQSDKHTKKLSKYFGVPKYKHLPSPHIRSLYFSKPSSQRVQFFPEYKTAKPFMIKVVRIKSVLDKFYFFGEKLRAKVDTRMTKHLALTNAYRVIRYCIGLPCNGQRTKTNARTSKKYCINMMKHSHSYYIRRVKYLKMICSHQLKEVAIFARNLKIQREEMNKLRIIKELQGMRRYRHKSSQDAEEHYENVYKQLYERKRH